MSQLPNLKISTLSILIEPLKMNECCTCVPSFEDSSTGWGLRRGNGNVTLESLSFCFRFGRSGVDVQEELLFSLKKRKKMFRKIWRNTDELLETRL